MAYKRKTYLINPPFQLRISFYVCLITLISSLIYPVTIYELMTSFSNFIDSNFPKEAQKIFTKKNDLLVILSLCQIGITGLIFIVCILISHKIAGPIFKLKNYLQSLKTTGFQKKLFFREGDYFQEVADTVNDVFDHLSEQRKQDFMYLSEVRSYLKNIEIIVPEDKKVVLNEINNKLSEIQNRFHS